METARVPGAGVRVLLRVAGAGLLAATAAIHLDLYLTGYRTIPTIGVLFLLQIIAGFGLAALVLATGNRLVAAAGAGFALSTLGGYLISVQFGLFGFKEVRTTAGIVAGLLEVAAFAVLAALALLPSRTAARAARAAGAAGEGGAGGRQLTGPYVRRRAASTAAVDALPGDPAPGRRPAGQVTSTRFAAPAVAGLSLVALALLGGALAGAGGSGSSAPVAAGAALRTETINGTKVLADAQGRTLYWFAPDTNSKSTCYGTCAQYWPPVAGPDHAGNGVTGALGTTQRTGGVLQETYNGHPLYTYVGDSGPGQAHGNNVNLNGGLWHEVVVP